VEPPHIPVLADEVVRWMVQERDGIYVDATYGRGGHAQALLRSLGPDGRLIVGDRDPEAVAHARRILGPEGRCTVCEGRFSQLGHWLQVEAVTGKVDGILFDLGVSSPQLDDPRRGFSFQSEGPLDMRMDPGGMTAAEWLMRTPVPTIERALAEWGEERYARRIARAIGEERRRHEPWTTVRLANLVSRVVPHHERRRHPATRTFLALRIAVNHELDELRSVLPQALAALRPGGRLAVVSFHSLEDRIVKRFMKGTEPSGRLAPVPAPRLRPLTDPIRPTEEESRVNPRARSALLRVAERLP
jgi:16S rRNA (cytosine1402-N4)-methyltransferase